LLGVVITDPVNAHRKYSEAKLQENLDSEIMEVLLQEARDSYDEQIVVELTSNTTEEMESNIDRIEAWVKQWSRDNQASLASEGVGSS
jgi:adenylate kinase